MVKYISFDQAVQIVRRYRVEVDIQSAFCLRSVHSENFELLGFSFEGAFYIDRLLPMGCSMSYAAFEKFSYFLEWSLK